MKRTTAVLFSAMVVLAPQVIAAQTLDEVQHPLLAKGKSAVSADYDGYAIEHYGVDLGRGSMTFFQPENVLFPQMAFGLGRNLQLQVAGTYQVPTTFSFPMFDTRSHFRDTTTVRSLSGELLFRPRPNLELGLSGVWGRLNQTLDYSRSHTANALARSHYRTGIVSVQGAWLPTADSVSRPIQSDLDGLNHPLLKKHRWKIDWEVVSRWYGSDFRDSDHSNPDFVADDNRSRDLRLRLGAAGGITGRLQVGVDGYWHPSFRMTQTSQYLFDSQWQPFSGTSDESRRFHHVYGARLNARWRLTQQAETFAEGRWEHQAVSSDRPVPRPWTDNYRTLTTRAGATWLSRGPTKSVPLAADLTGLYHPLVERKQLKLDALVHYKGDRGVVSNSDMWLWQVQATTGIWSWLQATAYGGTLCAKNFLSGGKFDRYVSLGSQLTLRVRAGTEVYASANYHPTTSLDRYPVFILGRGDEFIYYYDCLSGDFAGDANLHLGVRFIF
jgi:hypothetical protein